MVMSKRAQKRSMANFIGATGGTPAAPANTVAPTITGTAQEGQTLTAHAGTWTGRAPPALAYQWQADGTDIAGATGSTYVPVTADVGKTITVVVTGQNWSGAASATSAATAAVVAA